MAALPYVTATGNIERALLAIQSASTPARVSQDFVKTILKIPGGSGNQITSFLKKIGFTNPDGAPSDLYKGFRNASTAGSAAADALRIGYGPLYLRNEYMHQLSDDKLRGLIIEETGMSKESSVVGLILGSIKAIKKFADWSETAQTAPAKEQELTVQPPAEKATVKEKHPKIDRVGLNLSYTINLNLPATSDGAVFNAIFKALRENLLKEHDE
jgi:hypothetical protein